jgi:hypothetical protein
MDFLDPRKQKSHRIRLFIGYGLMAVALGIGTMVLFFQSYGYDLNPRTGEVVQNGLVFIDAHPEAATVKLNGQEKGQTDQRLDIPAGDYDLELSRSGYRTWKRSFALDGGSIERFVYPFLFPESLKTTDAQLYAGVPGLSTQSPDRRWLVIQQPGSFTNFDVIDLSSATASTKVISLPSGLVETKGSNHSLRLAEWSTDNRHVVLKHSHDGGNEFILLDIESAGSSVNLTKTFTGSSFSNVTLRDKKYDQYYLYSSASQTVSTAQLSTRQSSRLLDKVLTYKTHGSDVVVYAIPVSDDKVAVHIREGAYISAKVPMTTLYVSFQPAAATWWMWQSLTGHGISP